MVAVVWVAQIWKIFGAAGIGLVQETGPGTDDENEDEELLFSELPGAGVGLGVGDGRGVDENCVT